MNKNEIDSIRKYDSIAQNYDDSPDGKFTARFKEKILEFCKVSNGEIVLDVGCGNGSLINAINKKGDIQAYGIDISPNMISECRKRYSDITFNTSTGEKLDFSKNNFDVITICCVLHHLNNPQKFFEEAQRVLKPGGVLIVGDPWFPFGVRHLVDWVVSPLVKAGDNKIFSHAQLRQLFLTNGFEITETYKKGFVQIVKGNKITKL